MDEALKSLGHKDPVMKGLIDKFGAISLQGNYMESAGSSEDYFSDLARSIVGQQLSVKAASTIWSRVEALLCGEVSADRVLLTADEDLRRAGLSVFKVRYVKALAQAAAGGEIVFDLFKTMTDEEVISRLTAVKGVGRWTAEMFLIFSLGRPDVFSFGDGGLRNAMDRLYAPGAALTRKDREEIVERWAPYRTLACLYLWESLDNAPLKRI